MGGWAGCMVVAGENIVNNNMHSLMAVKFTE